MPLTPSTRKERRIDRSVEVSLDVPGETKGKRQSPIKTIKQDPFPTNFLPGTPEKMAILERRARSGLELFHPLDVSLCPGRVLDIELFAGNFARKLKGVRIDNENAVVNVKTLGHRLRQAREGAGLTLKALARRSGLSKNHLSDLERGNRLEPRASTLVLLARTLRLSLDYLLAV